MAMPATDHLNRLEEEARTTCAETRSLVDGLSEAQLLWRPAAERWGIADCFEHLVATGDGYHPGIRKALSESERSSEPGEYRPRLFGRLFAHFAGPNGKRRIRARGPFIPPPTKPDAPRRFLQQQEELLSLIADAAGADLQKARVPSPLSPLIRLTLGECLEVVVVHQKRHLEQARRVRESDAFPDA